MPGESVNLLQAPGPEPRAALTLGLARPSMVISMPRWSTPIRAVGRIVRAMGREIASTLRIVADFESQVSPQDVGRRAGRGEIGRDPVDDTRRPHESRDRDSQ